MRCLLLFCDDCDACTVVHCLVQPIGAHGGEVLYFGCFALGMSLVSWIVMISAYVL